MFVSIAAATAAAAAGQNPAAAPRLRAPRCPFGRPWCAQRCIPVLNSWQIRLLPTARSPASLLVGRQTLARPSLRPKSALVLVPSPHCTEGTYGTVCASRARPRTRHSAVPTRRSLATPPGWPPALESVPAAWSGSPPSALSERCPRRVDLHPSARLGHPQRARACPVGQGRQQRVRMQIWRSLAAAMLRQMPPSPATPQVAARDWPRPDELDAPCSTPPWPLRWVVGPKELPTSTCLARWLAGLRLTNSCRFRPLPCCFPPVVCAKLGAVLLCTCIR